MAYLNPQGQRESALKRVRSNLPCTFTKWMVALESAWVRQIEAGPYEPLK